MDGGRKISRSKIELFIDCPRCFWLDVKHGIKRPEMVLAGNIGQVYDGILKGYFDKHRDDSTVPDPVAGKGFKLYPAKDKLKRWRSCIEYHHKDYGITYWGKIDDLLIDSENRIVPFDFKTTLKTFSPEGNILEKYKRQLEIYGYLLHKNGEAVSNVGALYVVEIVFTINFEKQENHKLILLEDLNYQKWDTLLEYIRDVYHSNDEPKASDSCKFCNRDKRILELNNSYMY